MLPNGIPSYRPAVSGVTHMVSAGHYLATAAGYRVLEEGGNAVDAGVASGIALNVTMPHMTGFAGVAPIILYLAQSQEVVTISGLGQWPQNATLEYFQSKYGEIPPGIMRSVVPGACDAWLVALERYGTMSFGQVVAPAIELAAQGFPISHGLADSIRQAEAHLAKWPESCALFMPKGSPLDVGERFIREELANLFRKMVDVERTNAYRGRRKAIRAARDFFYKEDVAEAMVEFCQQQGGLLTMEDFRSFHVKVESPEVGSYKSYQIYTCGPWCQGPCLIQLLHILEEVGLGEMEHNSADYVHMITEAMKLVYADRHAYYGDPDFVDVPMTGLLSKRYAMERRILINPYKAAPAMPLPGDPWTHMGRPGKRFPTMSPTARPGQVEFDTTYTCVVDKWGNAFSATPSDSELTTPIVPGLGITISPRGSQSWLEATHPSCVAPGKRPRLTPCPAVVFREGHLFMPFGTPGGDAQVQAMTQTLLNIVEFGMDPQQAVEAPRFVSLSFPNSFWPHTYFPGRVALEGRVHSNVVEELTRRGHEVEILADWTDYTGGVCAIVVDMDRGTLVAGADPRRESHAVGR